ncbi:MAG: glycosyltransferase family 4 protein [Neisseria sp.]|nr:glycosyltransferase family 4 protein [Neisseria sp.]
MNKPVGISINVFRRGGGMESYTFDLVRQFAAAGERVRVYASAFDETLPEYDLIEPVLIPQKNIPKKLRPFWFARQLDKVRPANELLISCNAADNADVFICGGNHLGYLQGMGQRTGLLDRLTIRRNRTNYQSARLIMAHSEMMQRELVELYGVPSEKIRVVHPPADTDRYHPDSESVAAMREKYGFAADETVFVFPSTGHKRKGLDMLADFFEHTDLPVKLAVAGSPLPRPMRNVVELGFCKNMPELYRAADYTIMASLYEPFGLVGVESVLCGTRVVLADDMGCCEVMNDNAGFFFSRENPATLAAAVEKAVALKQQNKHKIADSFAALNYNPTSQHHFQELRRMLGTA